MHRILAALSAGILAVQAEAATLRYTFDVTGSTLGYSRLTDTDTGQIVAPGSGIYTDFVAAHHAQGAAMGQTGRVRLEIETGAGMNYPGGFGDGDLMRITCLSGFLCDLGDTGFLDGSGVFERRLTGTEVSEERFDPDPGAYLSGLVFDLAGDTGHISFANDADVFGAGAMAGTIFDWVNPTGRFELGNISRVELIPNPLPAPVFLLGAALIPLAVIRRRKNRV